MLQLAALGYILAPAFALESWWLVGLMAAALITVAAAEIVSRPGASYKVGVICRCWRSGVCVCRNTQPVKPAVRML